MSGKSGGRHYNGGSEQADSSLEGAQRVRRNEEIALAGCPNQDRVRRQVQIPWQPAMDGKKPDEVR